MSEPRRQGESLWQLWQRHREDRPHAQQVEDALTLLPTEPRDAFLRRLEAPRDETVLGAVSELLVTTLVRESGQDYEVEPVTTSGAADLRLASGVHIEVWRPSLSAAQASDKKRRQDVLRSLGKVHSPHFWLGV